MQKKGKGAPQKSGSKEWPPGLAFDTLLPIIRFLP